MKTQAPSRILPLLSLLLGTATLQCVQDFVATPEQPAGVARRAAVEVRPISATLTGSGSTIRLGAEALDANGFVQTGKEIAWTSLNPAVAAVDGSGLVTSAASGQAIIAPKSGWSTGRPGCRSAFSFPTASRRLISRIRLI